MDVTNRAHRGGQLRRRQHARKEMITGNVTFDLEAVIRLHVEGSDGQTQAFDFKIDTGFSDFVSLPIATVAALGLTPTSEEDVQIADGSTVRVAVYSGVVIWDGKAR